MPLLSRLSSREKRGRKRSWTQEKSKKEAQKLSRRERTSNARSNARLCARSTFLPLSLPLPPSLSLFADPSVLVARSVGEKKRSVRRARRTRGGRGSRKEGQTGRSERGTRGCHGYRRIPASPRCHGDASRPSLYLSLSLSPLSPALCPSPSSTRSLPVPFPPPLPLTHPSSHPPASLTPRFSPSSRQLRQASLYLSGSFAHILSSCSLGRRGREGRRDKERNARVREKREGKERMRDTLPDVFHDADVSRFSNRSISYRLKVIYVRPPSPSLSPSPYRGPSLAAA